MEDRITYLKRIINESQEISETPIEYVSSTETLNESFGLLDAVINGVGLVLAPFTGGLSIAACVALDVAINGAMNAISSNKDEKWTGEFIGSTFKLPWVHQTVPAAKATTNWNPLSYAIGDDLSKINANTLEGAAQRVANEVSSLNKSWGVDLLVNSVDQVLSRDFLIGASYIGADLTNLTQQIVLKYEDYIQSNYKQYRDKLISENIANIGGLWGLDCNLMCQIAKIPPVTAKKFLFPEEEELVNEGADAYGTEPVPTQDAVDEYILQNSDSGLAALSIEQIEDLLANSQGLDDQTKEELANYYLYKISGGQIYEEGDSQQIQQQPAQQQQIAEGLFSKGASKVAQKTLAGILPKKMAGNAFKKYMGKAVSKEATAATEKTMSSLSKKSVKALAEKQLELAGKEGAGALTKEAMKLIPANSKRFVETYLKAVTGEQGRLISKEIIKSGGKDATAIFRKYILQNIEKKTYQQATKAAKKALEPQFKALAKEYGVQTVKNGAKKTLKQSVKDGIKKLPKWLGTKALKYGAIAGVLYLVGNYAMDGEEGTEDTYADSQDADMNQGAGDYQDLTADASATQTGPQQQSFQSKAYNPVVNTQSYSSAIYNTGQGPKLQNNTGNEVGADANLMPAQTQSQQTQPQQASTTTTRGAAQGQGICENTEIVKMKSLLERMNRVQKQGSILL